MKEKLLLVSAIAPFPSNSGGATRIFHTIEYLGKKYELYFLALGEEIKNAKEKDFLNKNCQKWQVIAESKKNILSFLPYHFSNYYNKKLNITLIDWLELNKINHVRIEFSQLAYLSKIIPENKNKSLVMHDIATVAFERRMKEKKWGLRKLIALYWVRQIQAYEKKWLNKYEQIIAMSENDQQILRNRFYCQKIRIERNGIKEIKFLPKNENKTFSLGFIGSQSHPPNKTAIDEIVNKILPQLDEIGFAYKFYLAGDNQLEIKNEKIINLGRVKNKTDFFSQIDCLIAPIKAGSGTRIKILEALGYGKPVITSKIGAEGIELRHQYLQIVNDNQWLEKIKMVASWQKIDLGDLKQQLNQYKWEKVFEES